MPVSQQSSRRQFLQGIAAAGSASILLPSSQWAFGYQTPSERPVFATIGLRNQGWSITSKSFGFANFAALADVDSSVLAENVAKVEKGQGKKPDAYKDYRKILDRKDIDAVMIATPDHWHTKIAVEAMLAGKDVYCEKPLTLTIDEGKLIEKIVKQTGRVFQVGTMQRTEIDQRFLKAIALIKEGRIGTVKKVTCGIDRMEASAVIPEAAVPEQIDWDMWLRIGLCRRCEKVTAAACRSTAIATTRSATGTSTPAESSPTGVRITWISRVGRSVLPRPDPAKSRRSNTSCPSNTKTAIRRSPIGTTRRLNSPSVLICLMASS